MRRGNRTCLLGLALALLALAAGCGEDAERTTNPPPDPEYLPSDSPDAVIANLVLAMEAMDSLGYAALLYDGVQPAADGLAYAPYKFYFDQSQGGMSLPEHYLYAQELVCMGAMLGGRAGLDELGDPVPGVRSIDVDIAENGAWAAPAGDTVDEDSYPDGTVRRLYDAGFVILLKATYAQYVQGWSVADRLLVYCIPVQVGAATEYRLWKWREIEGFKGAARPGLVESVSLGEIKLLY